MKNPINFAHLAFVICRNSIMAGRENDSVGVVKIDPNRIEEILELIGEMVVIKSQLAHNRVISSSSDPELRAVVTLFDRTVRDLQDKTLALRLTSLKPLFQKVRRAVRDLAVRQGKNIEFVTVGEDIEIDRLMIDTMTDPLLHLARNAVDHGTESPPERASAKKPEIARLTMSARQSGGRVIVELSDDGRGIDKQRVLKKAFEQNLAHAAVANANPDDKTVFALLFEPGFSTTDQVTDVSGRGVGLDVVRNQVEKLRGSIEVESVFGQGATFRVSMPLTTAITDGMLVRVGRVKYVVPLGSVREIIRVNRKTIVKLDDESRVVELRGKFLPLLDLRSLLSSEKNVSQVSKIDDLEPILTAIVAEYAAGEVILLINEVLGQIQVVVKTLGESVRQNDGVNSGAILGDGTVALILDLDGVVRESARKTKNTDQNQTTLPPLRSA